MASGQNILKLRCLIEQHSEIFMVDILSSATIEGLKEKVMLVKLAAEHLRSFGRR
jgi:hypothetical protein